MRPVVVGPRWDSAQLALNRKRRGRNRMRTAMIAGAFVAWVFALIVLLIAAQGHFNRKEINQLVDEAHERGISYELTVHNEWTYSYTFSASEPGE